MSENFPNCPKMVQTGPRWLKVPLGADKMHDALKGVFSVFSNDKNKNYDTIQSAWEFSKNQEQPQVCRSIRLGVTLL